MRPVRALLAVALLLPAVLALFQVDWFESHEGASYPARVVEVTRCWQGGMWSARWFPDLAGGRGYPFLSFYAPLLFWAAGAFHAAGLSVALALKLVVILGTALGAAGAYRLARQATGREGAAATALLWTYAPYRLRDLWTRGDLAELLALAFLPWALAATIDVVRRPEPRATVRAAFFGAAAVISHNVAGMHTGVAMALAAACALAATGAEAGGAEGAKAEAGRARRAGATVAAGGLALALSAFFWVPALAERKWVHLDRLRSGFFVVEDHFVPLRTLFGVVRPARAFVPRQAEAMTFELGVAVFLAILGLFAFRDRKARAHVALGLALLVGGAVLATRLAAPVYRWIPFLAYGGLPWRTLGPASLGAALLAGLGIGSLVGARGGPFRATALALVAAASIGTVMDLLHPLQEIRLSPPILDPAAYRAADFTASVANEYVPVWSQAREEIPFREGLAAAGPATIRNVRRGVARWSFDVEAPQDVDLVFQDFFYPGWTVSVDGRRIDAFPRPGSGYLQIRLGAGRGHVEAALRPSPTRRLAGFASFTALLACTGLTLRRRST
ncbi:MAG: 6-pyruvoyl-tetrahydropterin synthase-related protein [bacterium]